MINPEELAICRRRSHEVVGLRTGKWCQCERCGIWLREVTTTEEREDDPPEADIGDLDALRRLNRRAADA